MRIRWSDPKERPAKLREMDQDGIFDSVHLEHLREKHEQADHGVHLVDAFVYCHEFQIHPPQWVVDEMGGALARWMDGEVASVDQALEITSKGKGKSRPLNVVTRESEDYFIAHVMNMLVLGCGIPVERAAEMLELRNISQGYETSDSAWIAEKYSKDLKKRFVMEPPFWRTEQAKKEFLDSFPTP